jgi:hypothetical protein
MNIAIASNIKNKDIPRIVRSFLKTG